MTVKVEQSDLHNPIRVENPYKGLDYNLLHNIPTVDGKEIKGDMTTEQLIGFDKDYVDETVTSGGATLVQQHNADETAHPYLLNATNTLKNDLVNLGEHVSNIESKIPENTSATNTLVNQTQLHDTELNLKEYIANDIEEHNISPTAHQDIRTSIETLQFVKWVDALPAQGESKYIYAVPREETDTDGKQIAALYLWDGSAWRGAGAFSLNIDPDTLATKAELSRYLPLSGGTLTGGYNQLKIANSTFADRYGTFIFDVPGEYLRIKNVNPNTKRDQVCAFFSFNGLTILRKGSILKDYSTNEEKIILSGFDKAVANGVASLDENAKVPENQLPDVATYQAILREW